MQLFFSLLYTSAYPCTHCITWAPLYTFVYTNVHFCVDLCIPLCAYYCHFVYFVHLERKPLVITLQEHATIFFRPGIFNKRESLTDIVRLKPLPAVTITLCYTENCIINMLLLTTVVSLKDNPSFIIVVLKLWTIEMLDPWGMVEWLIDKFILCLKSAPKTLHAQSWNKVLSNGDLSVGLNPDERSESIWHKCPNLCGKLIVIRSERKETGHRFSLCQTYTHVAFVGEEAYV